CGTSPDLLPAHDPAFSMRLFFLYSIDTSGCTVPHTCLHSDTAPYKAISVRPDASPYASEILYHFFLLFPLFLSPFIVLHVLNISGRQGTLRSQSAQEVLPASMRLRCRSGR